MKKSIVSIIIMLLILLVSTPITISHKQNLITYVIPVLNSDNDGVQGFYVKERSFKYWLIELKKCFSDTQITIFTYGLLVKTIGVTDSRGQLLCYEFGDFNQLKFIKNNEGKLLKEIIHNYKN